MKTFAGVATLLIACATFPITGLAQDAGPANAAPPATGTSRTVGTGSYRTSLQLPLSVQPLTVVPSLGRPFSAEGITTTTQRLADGTRLEQQTNTRLFRDSAGRVRREQSIVGLTQAVLPVVTITDPTSAVTYTLDSRTRTAYRAPLQTYVSGSGMPGRALTVSSSVSTRGDVGPSSLLRGPEGPDDAVGVIPAGTGNRIETLTTQQIAGLWSTGKRTNVRIAPGMVGNDRPFDVTTERWTSTDLNVVTLSRSNDPRVGTTEYRLTSVVRVEPPTALFVVPSGYRVVDTAARAADAGR